MGRYAEAISDSSVWVTATPNETVKKLPFYITEIGHFFARAEYLSERDFHDSCLFLFTVRGTGMVVSDGISAQIGERCACIIDCKKPHKYFSVSEDWEFIWFHFNGAASGNITELIYNNGVEAAKVHNASELSEILRLIMDEARDATIANGFDISAKIHDIINIVLKAAMERGRDTLVKAHLEDIDAAIRCIKENYNKAVTIDDILSSVHMSKYHFIRTFRMVTGVTPYRYITTYRINQAKIILRSTDKTVAEVSELCGFLDTSNFIMHFKKHTGQTPLQYRRDFT